MIDRATSVATTVAAVGCGSIAGVLLAFSISVMPALSSRSAPDAITTMQRINVAIVSPMFLTLFLGAAVAASTAAVGALISASGSPVLIVAGALLYVIGCVLVTVAINVPLNDALAAVDPSSRAGADVWSNYLVRWTRWNHVRTGAAFAACVLFTIAS
ncbi:anthrone oxygenase family protein [Rhodococcoides yunnanense]|uniref:anthrone oxygenase family protein n=1 Tax=Rhodococcoides yunnanense TaxID=278209 RepID=UPI0022B0D35F|nr:anthrone oxygenase family protein [Rhodococcus yunnanensis]MCZ4275481.1 DUF1772 domain-containing protein [Rhodococcus yunnanensis]